MVKNVELRKLPAGSLCSIAAILETNNDWKKVMAVVPRNPRGEYFEPKYNNEHIKQIEDHARASNRKCAEILFEEWGTSGRIRPTLSTLKDVVQKAGILRAADELAEMLGEAPPERPCNGPAAPINTDFTLWEETRVHNGTTKQVSDTAKESSVGGQTTAEMKAVIKSETQNLPDFDAMIGSEKSVNVHGDPNGPGYQTSFPNLDLESKEIDNKGIDTDILTDVKLNHFPYKELEAITKRFSERFMYTPDPDMSVQGKITGKIASGAFGDVYVGWHPKYQKHLAIKRARTILKFEQEPEIAIRVFNAEVKFLSQFRHNNIVPILGFSKDGPSLCVVCDYIDGGSLEQKIHEKFLSEKQRLGIMIGTIEGLKYLHASEKPSHLNDPQLLFRQTGNEPTSSKKNNFVHGDVKSANILLTRACVPKLCDFGLAKQYDSTFITTLPMGTYSYMAPEAFAGTITQKIDIYSYGIVLLELITGLKSLVVNNEKETINIKDYMEESCPNNDITSVLDPFIDRWTKAKEIYALAKTCLERQRKSRPTAEEISDTLYKISGFEREC